MSNSRLEPQGFAESFRRRALPIPERPALSFEGRALSCGEMQLQIERPAGCTLARGRGGDRRAERRRNT